MRKRISKSRRIGGYGRGAPVEQYEVYLQPQYNHRTRKFVGAEALSAGSIRKRA